MFFFCRVSSSVLFPEEEIDSSEEEIDSPWSKWFDFLLTCYIWTATRPALCAVWITELLFSLRTDFRLLASDAKELVFFLFFKEINSSTVGKAPRHMWYVKWIHAHCAVVHKHDRHPTSHQWFAHVDTALCKTASYGPQIIPCVRRINILWSDRLCRILE